METDNHTKKNQEITDAQIFDHLQSNKRALEAVNKLLAILKIPALNAVSKDDYEFIKSLFRNPKVQNIFVLESKKRELSEQIQELQRKQNEAILSVDIRQVNAERLSQIEKAILYQKYYIEEDEKFKDRPVAEYCKFPLPKEYSEENFQNMREWVRVKRLALCDDGFGVSRTKFLGFTRVIHYYYILDIEIQRLKSNTRRASKPSSPEMVSVPGCKHMLGRTEKELMDVLKKPYDFTEENYEILCKWDKENWLRDGFSVREVKQAYGSGCIPETDEGILAALRNGGGDDFGF